MDAVSVLRQSLGECYHTIKAKKKRRLNESELKLVKEAFRLGAEAGAKPLPDGKWIRPHIVSQALPPERFFPQRNRRKARTLLQ